MPLSHSQNIYINVEGNELLYGLIKGETWAYKELEKKTFPYHLKVLERDEDLAWDLYQDAIISFLGVLRNPHFQIPKFGGDQVAVNLMRTALDWKRQDHWGSAAVKKTESLNMSDAEGSSMLSALSNPEKELETKILRKRLDLILGKLAEKCRTLVEMKVRDGYKWERIYPLYDADTDSKQTMLRTDLSKCVKILRGKLQDFYN